MVLLAPLTNSHQPFSSANSILEQNKKGTAEAVPFISSGFSVTPCLRGDVGSLTGPLRQQRDLLPPSDIHYRIKCCATMLMNSREVITLVLFQNIGKCRGLTVIK